MRKFILMIICLLFTSSSRADMSDIDLLWKARGIQAKEYLADFKTRESNTLCDVDMMKYRVEIAYAGIIDLRSLTVKKFPDGTGYHLLLNFGKEDGVLDVVYLYDREGSYSGMRVDRLPISKNIVFLNDYDDFVAVGEKERKTEALLFFSKSAPLKATVMDTRIANTAAK